MSVCPGCGRCRQCGQPAPYVQPSSWPRPLYPSTPFYPTVIPTIGWPNTTNPFPTTTIRYGTVC